MGEFFGCGILIWRPEGANKVVTRVHWNPGMYSLPSQHGSTYEELQERAAELRNQLSAALVSARDDGDAVRRPG